MGDVADQDLIADTDIVIDFLRDRGPGSPFLEEMLRARRVRFTPITAFELRLGRDFSTRRRRIELLLRSRTLPLDGMGGLLAGEIFIALADKGTMVEIKDAMIAGTCLRFDLPLATRNLRHFERVPGLRLVPV